MRVTRHDYTGRCAADKRCTKTIRRVLERLLQPLQPSSTLRRRQTQYRLSFCFSFPLSLYLNPLDCLPLSPASRIFTSVSMLMRSKSACPLVTVGVVVNLCIRKQAFLFCRKGRKPLWKRLRTRRGSRPAKTPDARVAFHTEVTLRNEQCFVRGTQNVA